MPSSKAPPSKSRADTTADLTGENPFLTVAGQNTADNLCVIRVSELKSAFETISSYASNNQAASLFKPDSANLDHLKQFYGMLSAADLGGTALACGLSIDLPFQDDYRLFIGRERPTVEKGGVTHRATDMEWLEDLQSYKRSLEEFNLYDLGEGIHAWIVHQDHCKTRKKLISGSKTTLSGHRLSVRTAIVHEGNGLTQDNLMELSIPCTELVLTLFTGSMQRLCTPRPLVAMSSPQYGLLTPSTLEMLGYIVREFTENPEQSTAIKAVLDPTKSVNVDLVPSIKETLNFINPNLSSMLNAYYSEDAEKTDEVQTGSATPIKAMAWQKLYSELKDAMTPIEGFERCVPVESLIRLHKNFPEKPDTPSAEMLLNRMVARLYMLEITQYTDDDTLPLAVNLYAKTAPRVQILQKTLKTDVLQKRYYDAQAELQPSVLFTKKEAAFQYAEQLNALEGDPQNPYAVFHVLGDLAENWLDFLNGYVIQKNPGLLPL